MRQVLSPGSQPTCLTGQERHPGGDQGVTYLQFLTLVCVAPSIHQGQMWLTGGKVRDVLKVMEPGPLNLRPLVTLARS